MGRGKTGKTVETPESASVARPGILFYQIIIKVLFLISSLSRFRLLTQNRENFMRVAAVLKMQSREI